MAKNMKLSHVVTLTIFFMLLAPKLVFSELPGKALSIGGYKGDIYESSPRRIMWMVTHIAFGRPVFIQESHSIEAYGLASCFMGAVSKDAVQVQVFKLVFRSEGAAIKILNLDSFESVEAPGGEGKDQARQTNFRDADRGFYAYGTHSSGYKRVKNILILAGGRVSFEDLQTILDGLI
jgi:hypothetical protein